MRRGNILLQNYNGGNPTAAYILHRSQLADLYGLAGFYRGSALFLDIANVDGSIFSFFPPCLEGPAFGLLQNINCDGKDVVGIIFDSLNQPPTILPAVDCGDIVHYQRDTSVTGTGVFGMN